MLFGDPLHNRSDISPPESLSFFLNPCLFLFLVLFLFISLSCCCVGWQSARSCECVVDCACAGLGRGWEGGGCTEMQGGGGADWVGERVWFL